MERKAVLRVAGFTALLVTVFACAALAGGAIDPDVDEPTPHGDGTEAAASHEPGSEPESGDEMSGLAVAQDGYRLAPGTLRAKAKRFEPYSFTIVGPDGDAVTDFDVTHAREMHMIAVRRDLTGFQHLHPEMNAQGIWKANIDTSTPGAYRVFADFTVQGQPITLGTDLAVPGRAKASLLPPPSTEAGAGPGYKVALDRGGSKLEFGVSQNGLSKQVDPYLGADGHLVVLRENDLAFIHAHPQGKPGGSGPIRFDVDFPSDGRYRMFFQFQADDEVHTAPFTVKIDSPAAEAPSEESEEAHDGGH